jgi:hypothetical protein
MAEGDDDVTWRDSLDEELRNTPLVQNSPDLNTLAKQALDYQRMMGSSIRIPGEDASEEAIEDFRSKLGKVGMVPLDKFTEFVRPKSAEDYHLQTIPEETLGITQGDVDRWKAAAFEDGLSPEQFEAFAQRNIAAVRQGNEQAREEFQSRTEKLKSEWGPHGYDANIQRAYNAAQKFGGEELVASLKANPDPLALKAFADMGKQFEEMSLGDLEQPLSLPETKEEAAIKLQEITSNNQHAFNLGPQKAGSAAYNAAAKEVMRLKRITMGLQANAPDDMFAA